MKFTTMRTINEIIIHCSATRPDQSVSAAQIDKYHKSKGWDCIGYHYYIRQDGTIEPGRPVKKAGAHTLYHNQRTIGICYEGGVGNIGSTSINVDTRTIKQKEALYYLIVILAHAFPEIVKVSGHRDYNATACPCFDAHAEYQPIIDSIRSEKFDWLHQPKNS